MWRKAFGAICTKTNTKYLSNLATFHYSDRVLNISNPNWPETLQLNPTWLRDHCRCNSCYDHATANKKVQIATVGLKVEPKQVEIQGPNLHLLWPDGHSSTFALQWLWDNTPHNASVETVPHKAWKGIEDFYAVNYQDFMHSDHAVSKILSSIITYGVGLVRKVPFQTAVFPEGALAETLAKVFPAIRLGFCGRSFSGHPANLVHSLNKCTDMVIKPHTDQSYITEPAGLKVFCGDCNVHLVDGFAVARQLHDTNVEAWQTLSQNAITFDYTDSGHCYKATDTVIKLHPVTGKLWRYRFSPYHRGPIPLGLGQRRIERIDQSIRDLAAIMDNHRSTLNMSNLNSETLVFVNNWRVSIGMTTTVKSRIAAAFISHSDYLSVARTLGALPSPSPL